MGRTRQLVDLRGDAYRRADAEGATDRHPVPDVTRYVNQGAAALYDLLVEARGRTFFRKNPPQTIVTTLATSRYDLAADFYKLISVRRDGPVGNALLVFTPNEEPILRSSMQSTQFPTHYELRPGAIEILPLHGAGTNIVVDYVPVYVDMVADADTFDGINGWEEYAVDFAAKCMAVKDAEWELAQALDADMRKLEKRIQALAPTRDAFRPERVKDVRGGRRLPWPVGRRWPW